MKIIKTIALIPAMIIFVIIAPIVSLLDGSYKQL